jgi:trans-2,3-dihydro-3-hydroxyanthranilate isomerase
MTQRPARFSLPRFNKAALAPALGLKRADFAKDLPIESVSTGIFNLMVPLASRKALGKIDANTSALAKLLGDSASLAYCFVLAGHGHAFARAMVPWGIIEDPATGSAAGSLGAYLVTHEKLRLGEMLTITQGVEMGRPSHIEVEIEGKRGKVTPRVSGSAVCIMEGHIEA